LIKCYVVVDPDQYYKLRSKKAVQKVDLW
jgi:hypothetical protein